MDKKIHHPNEDCLRSFALGTLDEATTLFIRQHLETCNQCADSMGKSVVAFNPILAQEPVRKWAPGDHPSWAVTRAWQKEAGGGPRHVYPSLSVTLTLSPTVTSGASDTVPSHILTSGVAQTFHDSVSRPNDSQKTSEPIPSLVPDWASQIPLAKDGSSVSLQALSPALVEQKQYRIVRRLGEGSLGTVYLAHNLLFDREEAIKVISADLVEGYGESERFLTEMDAASRLNHPHIVASHGAMKWDNLLVFCMEYVAGENLATYARRYLKEKGPFPVANACYYGYQTALGLQHAHENGMVHQDIKPSNLMLFRNGHRHIVKILDFGLAPLSSQNAVNRSLCVSDAASRTNDAKSTDLKMSSPGTLHYLAPELAPEQVGRGWGRSIQADIYSLGCTLYHLLCGHPPFEGSSAKEILDHHAQTEAPRIDDLRPDVPYQVASIIRRMMSKDPAKRYETPAEVAQALTPYFKPDPPSKKMDAVVLGSSHAGQSSAPVASATDTHGEPQSMARPAKALRSAGDRGRFPSITVGGMVLALVLAVGIASPRLARWMLFPAEPKLGIVAIEGIPSGAVLHLDGVMVSAVGKDGKLEIPMDAGKDHLLEIKKEGFETWSRRIVVDEGSRKSIKAQLPVSNRPPNRPKVGPNSKWESKKELTSATGESTTMISSWWPWPDTSLFTNPFGLFNRTSGHGATLQSRPEPDPKWGNGFSGVAVDEQLGPLP